jgi:hypothetical protein
VSDATATSRCPELSHALLTTWNMNVLNLAPSFDLQGNRSPSAVAPPRSLWVAQPQSVVNRVDPVARNQLTWSLPVDPNQSVLRGIKAMGDNSVMIALENLSGTGSIRRLNPTTDTLTSFFLPTESAPFSSDVAPDGAFFFCEFSTNRIARLALNQSADNLTEWQLPGSGQSIRLSVDRGGFVSFIDQQRVGRLDPRRNRVVGVHFATSTFRFYRLRI